MTLSQKKDLINKITELLDMNIKVESDRTLPLPETNMDKPMEMLTVKECAALVSGLTEHTVRQLVAQDKVAYMRAGAGRNGKILISKISLLKYLGIAG